MTICSFRPRWRERRTTPVNWLRMVLLGMCAWSVTGSEAGFMQTDTAFFVSSAGNDSWSGKLLEPNANGTDGPFATIDRAREAVQTLKAQGPLQQPVTVTVRGGVYALSQPLVLTPEDSGTADAPITYAAFPGENPVISGGRPITGWRRGEGELWTAAVPGVKEGRWSFRQLWVNGQRRQRARTPNEGFFHVEGEITLEPPARFQFRAGDIRPEWAKQGDVEVIALQAWAEFRMPIRAVDTETHTVNLVGKCARSNREKNARYWVENTRDALDAPGEWYLDRQAGMIYYWPMPGEDLRQAEVIAPVLDHLVRIEGDPTASQPVSHLTLKGLTFSHTDWSLPTEGYTDVQAAHDIPAALRANGAVSCRIEECRFLHLGQYALEFARGCKDNQIIGCEMADLGAGGVKIGEPRIRDEAAEQTGGNILSDSSIHDIGIVYPAAVGIWIGQSGGNRIAHNHIHDTFYSAISIGWTWGYGRTLARENVVEFNHAHHIGRGMLSDMGGIYTLGVQPGTVIRNNRFHDIESHGYGGWGIYPDEGSSQILIENNIVYRTKSGGFHQHYGRENVVRNNIFALAREGQIIRTRQEPHLSFTFERNIVYWTDGPLLGGRWPDDQYRLDHNLYFKAGSDRREAAEIRFAEWSLPEWQQRGQDTHSLIADPLFLDPQNGDFTLKPGSPAAQIGFQPIDTHQIGPRKKRSAAINSQG